MPKVTQTFIDHSREYSRTSYFVGAAGAGDDYTTALADADAIHDAMAAVTLCNFGKQSLAITVNDEADTIPGSTFAQRELALWIQGTDGVDFFTMSIPGPAMLLLAQANTDEVDIESNVTALALIAVLEAHWANEAGEYLTVTRMRIIGRRN